MIRTRVRGRRKRDGVIVAVVATVMAGVVIASGVLAQASTSEPAAPDPAACLDEQEAEFLRLINDYRRENDVPELAVSKALNQASYLHSKDMADNDYVDHDSEDGRTPEDRMAEQGYEDDTTGENIAAGHPTAEEAFETWRDSSEHNEAMLDEEFTAIGIGYATNDDSEYGEYWTTDFGGEAGEAPDCGATPDPSGSVAPSGSAAPPGTPSPSTSGSADPTTPPGDCRYPADVLDLKNWEITLPVGEDDDNPKDVYQPELATFALDPWFIVTAGCGGVRFRSPVNGATTENSKNPRSELREMNGEDEAGWSADEGTHVMTLTESFNHLPNDKPHLVGAQIHGGDDDVIVFRLEGSSLWLTNGDDTHHKLVTDDYQLGTKFEAKFVASGGEVKAYYNGELQTTLDADFSEGYFKAGAYTQANCENSNPCNADNYGETTIYALSVAHS
ncbi:MAG: polysaccharide lyase family 7 protein [Micromonosporaceae bacterium]